MKVNAQISAKYDDGGTLKGIAQVCLGSSFLVTGVRIIEGANGLQVFMPSRKLESGKYKDICFPLTAVLYKQIKDSVLAAYEAAEVMPPDADVEA